MKSRGAIAALTILVLAVVYFATTNSSQSFVVSPWPGVDLEARRQAVVEFAATHDWDTDLARAGISLRRGVRDQVLAPFLAREVEEGDRSVSYRIEIEERGAYAFAPSFVDINAALDWMRARLDLQAGLIDAASGLSADLRAHRIWEAYGSGFDAPVREFLAERVTIESDPVVLELCEELLDRLGPGESAPGN